ATGAAGAAGADAAQAGPVSVTQPIEGASWKIGGSEQVAWTNVKEGVDKLIINLMNGDASALTFVQTLASEIDAKANNTTVEVPANVTAGDYSLAIGADESNMAYIGGLKIEEGDGSDESKSAVAEATSAVVGAPSAAESGAAEATSAVAGAPSAAESGAAEATSTSPGKVASATDKIGSAAGDATSKVGSAAGAATSKVGESNASATNSPDSGAIRNLASGFALALPAAVL
ncbi:hypothetical protein BD770DRAFT_294578, partial [Pilaira anomala]